GHPTEHRVAVHRVDPGVPHRQHHLALSRIGQVDVVDHQRLTVSHQPGGAGSARLDQAGHDDRPIRDRTTGTAAVAATDPAAAGATPPAPTPAALAAPLAW